MALRRSVKKDGCDEYECTCDGGPYLHGPAGRNLVLAQLKSNAEEKKDEEDKK